MARLGDLKNFKILLKSARFKKIEMKKNFSDACKALDITKEDETFKKRAHLPKAPEKGELMINFLKRLVKAIQEILEEIPLDGEGVSLAILFARDIKEYCSWIKRLQSEYIFSKGHAGRMHGRASEKTGHFYPKYGSGWFFYAGLKADVILAREPVDFRIYKGINEVYNSERNYTFHSYDEFAKFVIAELSAESDIIEDVKVLPKVILVKAPDNKKGLVIGAGGARIKTMQEILGRRIKVI